MKKRRRKLNQRKNPRNLRQHSQPRKLLLLTLPQARRMKKKIKKMKKMKMKTRKAKQRKNLKRSWSLMKMKKTPRIKEKNLLLKVPKLMESKLPAVKRPERQNMVMFLKDWATVLRNPSSMMIFQMTLQERRSLSPRLCTIWWPCWVKIKRLNSHSTRPLNFGCLLPRSCLASRLLKTWLLRLDPSSSKPSYQAPLNLKIITLPSFQLLSETLRWRPSRFSTIWLRPTNQPSKETKPHRWIRMSQ